MNHRNNEVRILGRRGFERDVSSMIDDVLAKVDNVFRHVFRAYSTVPSPYYGSFAPVYPRCPAQSWLVDS
ncbi:MAG: hypothetical protein KJO08_03210 [Gammaproteobacteria bacterium]|nr:hypothetical protein [Gammaproteobacteria bacterium]